MSAATTFWSIGNKLVTNAQGKLVLCNHCPCPPNPPIGTGSGTTSAITWTVVDGGGCGPLCIPSRVTLVVDGDPSSVFGAGTWTLEYTPGFVGDQFCTGSPWVWVATQSFIPCLPEHVSFTPPPVKWYCCVPLSGGLPHWNAFNIQNTTADCIDTYDDSDIPTPCRFMVDETFFVYHPAIRISMSYICALACSRTFELTLSTSIINDPSITCCINPPAAMHLILPSPN